MPKAIKVFVLIVVSFAVFVVWLFDTKFRKFEHQSVEYYTDFATAGDFMLAHYPLGTNKFIEIPVSDPSLPKIVSNLQPVRIKLSTDWVWILVDGSHTDGLNVTWEASALSISDGEGPSKVVYVKLSKPSPHPP